MNEHFGRYSLSGYEKLISLGGFIQEIIEDKLRDAVPTDVMTAVDATGHIDESFWFVAQDTEELFFDFNSKYFGEALNEEDYKKSYVSYHNEFYMQTLILNARLARKRFKNKNRTFFKNWEISGTLRRILSQMHCYEEIILSIYLLESSERSADGKMTDQDLADYLMISPKLVRMCLSTISTRFVNFKDELAELEDYAAKEREKRKEKY